MRPCYNTDKLYLLELMVNRLCIDYNKVALSNDILNTLKQVVVFCKFQEFPELEIREEEFCKVRENYDTTNEIVFKSGKSCLFSIRGLAENLDFFMIHVKVARESEGSGGCIVLGTTCVQLDCHFVEVLKRGSSQHSRSIEETYPVYSKESCCIGNITLCVRLSSLGNMILTSVKGGKGDEPFAVKGEGVVLEQAGMGDYSDYGRLLGGTGQMYPQPHHGQQYGPQPQHGQQYGPQPQHGPQPYDASQGGIPYGPMQSNVMPYTGIPSSIPYGGTQGFQEPDALQQTFPSQPSTVSRPQDPTPFCGHVPIRSSSSSSEEEPPPPPPKWPPEMFCSCDYPLPPGFDEPPPPPPKKKKKKKDKNPCPLQLKGNYCLKPGCPMGYPPLPGFPPPKKSDKTCAQFPLQGGSIGLSNNNMLFQPQGVQMGPNAVTLEDEKNDIYILKIGSKYSFKKPKFILELKTPKIKIDEVKTQEMDSQYRETDFYVPPPPKEPKGKKGKKGKKDKKGKGKKGKGKGKGKKK